MTAAEIGTLIPAVVGLLVALTALIRGEMARKSNPPSNPVSNPTTGSSNESSTKS